MIFVHQTSSPLLLIGDFDETRIMNERINLCDSLKKDASDLVFGLEIVAPFYLAERLSNPKTRKFACVD